MLVTEHRCPPGSRFASHRAGAMPCGARGGFPSPPIPAPLFPSVNPPVSAHNQPLSPARPSSSRHGRLRPRPRGPRQRRSRRAATASWRCAGGAPGSGCRGAAALSPAWTLAPDVSGGGCSGAPSPASGCPPRSIGESGRCRALGTASGLGWVRAAPSLPDEGWGRDPSAIPKVGLEETSPRNRCLGVVKEGTWCDVRGGVGLCVMYDSDKELHEDYAEDKGPTNSGLRQGRTKGPGSSTS